MEKEDYTDPICPFCNDMFVKKTERIPIDRVISRLDGYFGKNDYDGAERHLAYWLSEAETVGDKNGAFTIKNELIGFYRKTGRLDHAEKNAEDALALIKSLEIDGSVSAATAYLNCGTMYKAMELPEKSLSYFEKAQKIYEEALDKSDSRLAGLYNNTALTLVDLGEYKKADFYYKKALGIMKDKKNARLSVF